MERKSAKNKGRRLVYDIKSILLKYFKLEEDDILIPSGSQPGEDIQFSPLAKKLIPFSIEAKNQEKLSIWSALKQCEGNSKGRIPLLIFKRNRTRTYAVIELEELLKLMVK
jgi:hypothetical protein